MVIASSNYHVPFLESVTHVEPSRVAVVPVDLRMDSLIFNVVQV